MSDYQTPQQSIALSKIDSSNDTTSTVKPTYATLDNTKDIHIYETAGKSTDNRFPYKSNKIMPKSSIYYNTCCAIAIGITFTCVCTSLAVAVWSAVKISNISTEIHVLFNLQSNATQEIQLLQSKNLNSTQEIDLLRSQLQNTIDSLQAHFMIGRLPSTPASSCLHLSLINSSSPSGYYWVRASNGSAVRVYCDMTRSCGGVTGGWTRVAYLQFENGSDPCPDGFRERSDTGISTCGISSTTAACPSILFDTYGIPYSRVCGKVLAYQDRTTDAFHGRTQAQKSVDSNYVDGVSLTHGRDPRKHIWTFVAALDDGYGPHTMLLCPCSRHPGPIVIPTFIGQDYFCDSGIHTRSSGSDDAFHGDDPLWDGAGCGQGNSCCEFNNPPWFHKQLPQPTTDDIEMRVCSDEGRENEDVPIAQVEIYVH